MEEICSECDFDESGTPPRDVAAALAPLAVTIRASIRDIPDPEIRCRPAPTVWSPLEYLGHLRESMAFHRWLIEKAVAENNPVIPMVDPDESVASADYNTADTEEILGQFDRRVERLCERLTTLNDNESHQIVTLGGQPITIALIARSAWHECHHHCGDIRTRAVDL